MTTIFGHLNVNDGDRVFNSVVGQRAFYDAIQGYLTRVNTELSAALGCFVSETTEDFKRRYHLPATGYLQKRGSDGRYGSVKSVGSWDVAFPIDDYGDMITGNDVDMAYMTVAELNRHVTGIVTHNINTVRLEVMRRLLNNTDRSFVDRMGTLTVMSLANGDAVVYPPVIDSMTEATEDHMYYTGYATASISDTNDPIATIVTELNEHFGNSTENVVFINNAEKAKIAALAKFTKVVPPQVNPAASSATVAGTPSKPVPGTIIGYHSDGAWVSEWGRMPATYLLGVSLEADPPLIRRVDPADTGLGDGLQLVAIDEQFPFMGSTWRHRFGFGVGNRLNGVVLQTHTSTGYDIPTGFTY